MTCIKKETLLQYLDCDCSNKRYQKISRHLMACPICRAELEKIEDKINFIKDKSRLLDPPEIPHIPHTHLLHLPSSLSHLKKRARFTFGRKFRPGSLIPSFKWLIPSAAGLLLLVLFLFPPLYRKTPAPVEFHSRPDLVFSAQLDGQPAHTYIFKEKNPEMTIIWITRF